MRKVFIFMAFLAVVNSTFAATPAIQTDRYTTVKAEATAAQINPLLAMIQIKFPISVQTIGDAVHYILQYSGYDLTPLGKQSPLVKATLSKPLPIVDRNLGPIQLQSALTVLMGEAVFELEQDPVHRLVSFKLKPKYAKLYSSSSQSGKEGAA